VTQSKLFQFHSPETARKHNSKISKVADVGVYAGYFPRVNAGVPSKVDLLLGNDAQSELVTSEGVKIIEDVNLLAAVQCTAAPSATLTRFDLIVGEYQFTNNTATSMIYKVVTGTFQASVNDPVPVPEVQNIYQVPIALVKIRPGGSIVLTQTDLFPLVRGQDLIAPSEVGSSKAVVDPTDTSRLFVYGGQFYSKDGTQLISFPGAYSEAITPVGMGSTNYQYFLLNDGTEVVNGGTVSTYETNPPLVGESIPLVVVEVTNPAGTSLISRVRDLRSGLIRNSSESEEIDELKDMLGDSTFLNLIPTLFTDDGDIDLTTLADGGIGAGLSVYLDATDSSLTFEYDGSVAAGSDVTVATPDMLTGAGFSDFTDFALVARHDIDTTLLAQVLQYDRSFTSAIAGFSGTNRDLSKNILSTVEVVRIAISAFHVKLVLPAGLFLFGTPATYKISSLGLMVNTDPETSQVGVVIEDSTEAFRQALKNAIVNPFQIWSRPDSAGNFAEMDENTDFELPISITADDITNKVNQFGPDGWQAMWTTPAFSGAPLVRRVPVGGSPSDVAVYALEVDLTADPGDVLPLEFRIPWHEIARDKPYSFAVDVDGPVGSVQISIIPYKKNFTGAGNLTQEFAPVVTVNNVTSERLTLTSDGNWNTTDDTYAIGFRINLIGQAVPATIRLTFPMATSGAFPTDLPFVRSNNILDQTAGYVERAQLSNFGYASDQMSVGFTQSQIRKHKSLGTLRVTAITATGLAPTLSNLSNSAYTTEERTLTFTAVSGNAGPYIVDAGVISEVIYEEAT